MGRGGDPVGAGAARFVRESRGTTKVMVAEKGSGPNRLRWPSLGASTARQVSSVQGRFVILFFWY